MKKEQQCNKKGCNKLLYKGETFECDGKEYCCSEHSKKTETKNYRITVRFTKKQRKLLENLAKKQNCTLTDLIIQALLERFF